jgi:uncharacterized protein (DUF488 family)
MPRKEQLTVWTIGHSTRSIEDFIALLNDCSLSTVADVRMFPGSRRYPQFNKENLSESLAKSNIDYSHIGELGGRRRAHPDSPNTAWRNQAFRGYADYMMTAEFHRGVTRLLQLTEQNRTVIMCAEALWWQCHRALISDCLKAKSIKVIHILGIGKTQEHPFTSAARIIDGRLSYTKERPFDLPL